MQDKEIHQSIKEINNKSLNIKDLVSISKNVDYCKVNGNKISEDLTS